MANSNKATTVETAHHVIELSEGCLTIDEKQFPDGCVSLDAEEAKMAVRSWLEHRYGRKVVTSLLQE